MPTIEQLVREGRKPKKKKSKTAGSRRCPTTSWGVHTRLHRDPEEAELGASESLSCSSLFWCRSHGIHPRRRPQPPGAQHGAGAWWSCPRPPRVSDTKSYVVPSTPPVSASASRHGRDTGRRRLSDEESTRPEATGRARSGIPVGARQPGDQQGLAQRQEGLGPIHRL